MKRCFFHHGGYLLSFFLLMLITAAVPPVDFQNKLFVKGQSFTSGFGKRKKIILPDQTEVILNSNSTLWLSRDFSKQKRTVLLEGEALFTIKNNSRQFIINTPHLILSTTTAEAKVNAYPDVAGEETFLLSGNLKVIKSYYSKIDPDPYYLKTGDMLMMNKDIDLMEKETFNIADLKAWIQDELVLKNVSLDGLIRKLKEWYNVEIEVSGKVPENLKYTGTFSHSDLQEVLKTVGKIWQFRYQAHQNTLLLKF